MAAALESTLRTETRHLIGCLGWIIEEQAGADVFATVESVRRLAKQARREPSAENATAFGAAMAAVPRAQAEPVAHAFSLFFQLVNACEERERLRRLAARSTTLPMSLRALFEELRQNEVPAATLQRCLDQLEIEPVLTAHPTEARRRVTLNLLHRLSVEWADPSELMETLWHTKEVREATMDPPQEVRHALFFFDLAIYEAAARFGEDFDALLRAHYPEVSRRREFLTFASWVGGDRDGNPFVTPEVSVATADLHRRHVVRHYQQECRALRNELTHIVRGGIGRADPNAAVADRFEPDEEFRWRLSEIERRLGDGTCTTAEALLSDLESVRAGLEALGARRAAGGRLARLIRQVRTFGLHLGRLDFREHSTRLESDPAGVRAELHAMRRIQLSHGPRAADRFILSLTRSADDLLRLLALAQECGLTSLDLVPLFETIDDLERAPEILGALWDNPTYRTHLFARGGVQEVMIGYSDSNKDGGYFAANWALHCALEAIANLADARGVQLRFFHGKGGSIDRGGGMSHRSLRAQPRAAHGARLRITEQGEVVSLKYTDPPIARRNLEQLASAVIAGYCLPGEIAAPDGAESLMAELARRSLAHYQGLVFGTPGFLDYFREGTPIDLLENLRMGSRPAKRAATNDVRQLRAIPWVFAWTQSRALLSAWYGIGHAVAGLIAEDAAAADRLAALYARWPFFAQLVDNAELSLAKVELGITRLYASLVTDAALGDRIFGLIENEYGRARQAVARITGRASLLENQPALRESIARRNPYIDPLNHLQVRYLREWRATPPEARSPELRRLLSLTVSGIAFGMKSTG